MKKIVKDFTDLSREAKHRTLNNWLSLLVIFLGLYLVVFPFLPYFELWGERFIDSSNGVRYTGRLADAENVDDDNLRDPPTTNRLVIPSISLDEQIFVGSDPANVDLGVWQRPQTSSPDKGGNTVLVGHRFSYSSPATFYHLDKVQEGDKFAIWWDQEEFVYEVYATYIVGPEAVRIEENTDEKIATLYTCTPVWTAKDRLVVRARLIEE